eukprot:gene10847-7513_t
MKDRISTALSAYEHLSDAEKENLSAVFCDTAPMNSDSLDKTVSTIIQRRAKNGESLDMDDVVNEAVLEIKAGLNESFRNTVFQQIAKILL